MTRSRSPRLTKRKGQTSSLTVSFLSAAKKQITVGHPLVSGANVEATVVGVGKSDKVMILKKKKRKGYRLRRGHRQAYTEVKITNIAI